MNDNQIEELINRIVNEVLARIEKPAGYKALALVPEVTAYSEEAAEYLGGVKAAAALFGEAEGIKNVPCSRIDTAEERAGIIKTLRDIEQVVLVAPSLNLLCKIADGDDTVFEAKIFEKSILDGKKTTVLLDFLPPKFKKGTLFEKAISAIDTLVDMQVEVAYLGSKSDEGYKLITEYEVNEAAKRGIERLQCAQGAIVTPLARDAAKDKGITIDI